MTSKVRQREGKGPALCRALAVCLRLSAVAAHSVGVLAGLIERALERSATVLLQTVAEERL